MTLRHPVVRPLGVALAFLVGLVFGVIFERGGPGYPAFLLTGLVTYRWFDTSVRTAMNVAMSDAVSALL